MKTPEEIKKGLECCASCLFDCPQCSYYKVGDGDCVDEVKHDALSYIQQLEAKVTNLERVRATQATSVMTMQDALFKQQLHQSRLLEEMSQLEARVPRWIPVEERLPEEGVDVVIRYGKDGFCEVASRSGENWHCADYVVLGGEWVTHWMPLPEPPEEVQHK